MISIEHTFGGALISIKIRPISETTPMNPDIARIVEGFLSMMERANYCGMDQEFNGCLNAFLEEISEYLDDAWLARDIDEGLDETTSQEIDDFVTKNLDPEIRELLKKSGRKK